MSNEKIEYCTEIGPVRARQKSVIFRDQAEATVGYQHKGWPRPKAMLDAKLAACFSAYPEHLKLIEGRNIGLL